MKKLINFLMVAAMLLGLGLTACNNETPEVQKETAGTLTINIVQAGAPATKLAGDLSSPGNTAEGLAAEKTINKVEVWVFAGENLEQYKTGTDNPMLLEGLSSGEKAVAVVVNGNIGSKATLTELKAVTNTLSQDLSNGMLMSWIDEAVTLVKCPAATASNCNEITAQVERVNARVALVGLSTNFNSSAPFSKFELEEVTLLNVRETSLVFGTGSPESLITTSKFLYGSQYPSLGGLYVGFPEYNGQSAYAGGLSHGVATSLKETIGIPLNVTGTPLTAANAKYFYVHENDDTENQETILVLKGKLKNASNDTYILEGVSTDAEGNTYYAIWVNAVKDGYTSTGQTDGKIARNTQYNIDVTLTRAGSATIDPTETACLQVTVSVKQWTVVNQTVTW